MCLNFSKTRKCKWRMCFVIWLFSISVIVSSSAQAKNANKEDNETNIAGNKLENEHYLLEIGPVNGRITRILDKAGRIDLIASPNLADNFRLLISSVSWPAGEQRWVFGKEQELSSTKRIADGLILNWDGPLKDRQGTLHDIRVRLVVRFVKESIEFKLSLRNNSPYKIAQVRYPLVGGLQNFGSPTAIYPPPANKQVALPFGAYTLGYTGQLARHLNMAFVDINNSKLNRGMYFGSHDKIARYKQFHFNEEKHEATSDISVNLIHFPYTPPGQEFKGSAVVIQFHDGDWVEAGKKIYRPWFKAEFGLMEPSDDWIRQQSFFQMIMILLPEGNVNYTFKEIPQLAKDGLKYGVPSLQIAGWQRGGHDNGYPYYEPDPRLGTWEELEEAISECHKMGAKVYFFVNILTVHLDTQWYKNELKDYDAENPHGEPYWIVGFGMGTMASRLGHTMPLMVYSDLSFPKLAQTHLDYFKKLAEIGADGIHIDKMIPSHINYNPRLEMAPDTAPFEGAIRLIERIDKQCRAIHPDFRISFECQWDRVLTYGAGTWWVGNMSSARKVFPELVETLAYYQPYDYLGINNAVRMGWAAMLGPHKFNRSMDCETWKGLSNYIKEVKRIRDELADTVFFGEFLDTKEVQFQEQKLPSMVAFNTFRNLKTGKRACILTNHGMLARKQTLLNFEGNSDGHVRIHKPFQKTVTARLPVEVVVEPERIAFVVEQ